MSTSPPTFAIDVAPHARGSVRLHVRGELDMSTSPQLEAALGQEIGHGGSVLLDLSEVTFIDSTALNALIRTMRLCEENGGALTVSPDLPDQVKRVFELTGLDGVLPIASEEIQEPAH